MVSASGDEAGLYVSYVYSLVFAPRGKVSLSVCVCVCVCVCNPLCGSVLTYFFHGCVCPEVPRKHIFRQGENVQMEPASLSQPGARGLAGVDKDAVYPPGMQ